MADPRRSDEPAKGPRQTAARPDPWPRDAGRKPGSAEPRPEGRAAPDPAPEDRPGVNTENPPSGESPTEPPPRRPEDAAWDEREPAEEVAAHQAEDMPPGPRGHRLPPESRVGPGQGDRETGSAWRGMAGQRGRRRHPVGIVVIAALLGLQALSAIGWLITVAVSGPGAMMGPGVGDMEPGMGPGMEQGMEPGMMAAASTGTFLALAVYATVSLVLLYGLWRYRRWGWWAVLIGAGLYTAASLWTVIGAATAGVAALGGALAVAIGLAILWYLTRPGIKALYFG